MPMTRRSFLARVAATPVAAVVPSFAAGVVSRARTASAIPEINGQRLRDTIERLSVYGRPAGGTFTDGVSRVAYSDADVAARLFVMDLIRAAGLAPRVDPAGNIIARRAGVGADRPPILFGSHIDSVPNGGNFDGPLGSLAALEVLRTLGERGVGTTHPLELVIWSNEEGVAYGNGLSGSRAAAGELLDGELDQVWNGVKKAEAIRRIGGDPTRLGEARRPPGSIHGYVELHVEQGGTLDQAGIPLGIVEGIVAIDRYEAVIRGTPNHAGTTPMPDRHDALVAASQLVLAVRDIVTREPGRQVGTVGQLAVSPNAPNVVPGLVRQTIELRDLSREKLARLAEAIGARAREIAATTRTEIAISLTSRHDAAFAAPAIQSAIETAARELGLAALRLPSGAGHDAQMMARLGPMGMIFVPSVGGISHSPKEWTSWVDCARGANVLLRTVLAMDRMTVPS
jgi:beta-ureidopropionase / N-carbamoyl-L-amino-acid hydrolase